MASDRIVVGATADDVRARTVARRLRDAGHEIVFVGGDQSPDQLARTAVAEDAVRLVVDADPAGLGRVVEACARLDASDVVVEPVVQHAV
jgi:methylmalonyl-CoA mutase C-terminal domain/subunit